MTPWYTIKDLPKDLLSPSFIMPTTTSNFLLTTHESRNILSPGFLDWLRGMGISPTLTVIFFRTVDIPSHIHKDLNGINPRFGPQAAINVELQGRGDMIFFEPSNTPDKLELTSDKHAFATWKTMDNLTRIDYCDFKDGPVLLRPDIPHYVKAHTPTRLCMSVRLGLPPNMDPRWEDVVAAMHDHLIER